MKFKNLESNFTISKAAFLLGFLTLLSRLVGLLRDRLFASHFGANDTLDVYYAAFRIPDFVFNLLILGTLSVAFIPVFTELLFEDKKRANKNASTILNFSFLAMAALCLILLIFIHPLTKMLVPGFGVEKLSQAVLLTRLFLISPVIFTLSNVFSSILNAQKKFIVVGLAPILYNFGIIFGLIFLYPRFGILGLGYGVIIGAILHLLVQIPEAVKYGYKWEPVIDLKDKALRKMMKLFIPRIFGMDNSQISLLIGSAVGSILASGSITVFNLANNLQAVPLGIFAISYSIAAFPSLSEFFAKKDEKGFIKAFDDTAVKILYFIIPISILMLLLRAHIVRLAFGAGKFDWSDTILTFNTLGIFTFSLFSQSLIPLISRAFYARQNTKTPVFINLGAMILNLILAYFFSKKYGVAGMAAGFSISNVINFLVLSFALRRNFSKFTDTKSFLAESEQNMFTQISKILFAGLLMGIAGYGTLYGIAPFVNTHTGFGLLVQAGSAAFASTIVYLAFTYFFGLEQSKELAKFAKKFV
jgi:putative peptidoglycan lipid II flippase